MQLLHSCQNLKATKMSFSKWIWIKGLWHVQTMEYYPVLERNELSSQEKTCMNLRCRLLSEKSQSEKSAYYMVPSMYDCLQKIQLWRQWTDQWCPGITRDGGRNRQSTEDFRAAKLFCVILQMLTDVTHLSKPTKCKTPRVNPNVICGLQICQV